MHVSSREYPSISRERLDGMTFNDEGITAAAGEKAEVSMSLPTYIAADNYRFSRLWTVLIIYDVCLHSSSYFGNHLRRTYGYVAKAPRDAVFVGYRNFATATLH